MSRAASSAIALLLTLSHASSFGCSTFSSGRPSMASASTRRRSRRTIVADDPPATECNKSRDRHHPAPLRTSPNDDVPDYYAGGGGAGAIGGDLATALARLDEEWRLARNNNDRDGGGWGGKRIGDWTVLDASDDGGGGGGSSSSSSSSSSSEVVYLLEPASGAAPSCVVFFLGGAVLGQFPHISYSSFLKKLASKTGASVVAVPYEVGLDHFGIARRAVKRMKNAVIRCEDDRGYSPGLPKYAVGHSLGAKLHSIGIAATGIGGELSGVGCVSYNNFGFAETIKMARSFVAEMRVGGRGSPSSSSSSSSTTATPFDALFDLAGMAVSAVGLEFTPSPADMDKILRSKFDEDVLKKIRMFCFDDDDLDSTDRFLDCFEGGGVKPSVSYLPGTHLTVSVNRLSGQIP
jgi:hypothetical protein